MKKSSTPITLIDFLQKRAQAEPSRHPYSYMMDGEGDAVHINYGEFYRDVQTIAAQLQSRNIHGERALLLYSPGIKFLKAFLGCLYAGVIAVPAYPPRLKRPSPWIESIVSSAQPCIVLSEETIHNNQLRRSTAALTGIDWLLTDQLDSPEQCDPFSRIKPETVAYLQYTSGSTTALFGSVSPRRSPYN